ncbi:hypothetical protein Taro_018714 [Colocasia esculenta]|uniref:Uncharacterized protein n=1 Tax=Colocasia esculenta TaxID=4460 RepID=A0A843UZY2_COLES|nr:hypothetical protein [Colocasia esculenta]
MTRVTQSGSLLASWGASSLSAKVIAVPRVTMASALGSLSASMSSFTTTFCKKFLKASWCSLDFFISSNMEILAGTWSRTCWGLFWLVEVVEIGGYGRRKTRPLRRVVGWAAGCLAEDSVAAEGWSGPGGGRIMWEGADMMGGRGTETGGVRGRIMGEGATGADVDPTSSMTALAIETKGGID